MANDAKKVSTPAAPAVEKTAEKPPSAPSKKQRIFTAWQEYEAAVAKIEAAEAALEAAREAAAVSLGQVVNLLGGKREFSVQGKPVVVRHSQKRGFYIRAEREAEDLFDLNEDLLLDQ